MKKIFAFAIGVLSGATGLYAGIMPQMPVEDDAFLDTCYETMFDPDRGFCTWSRHVDLRGDDEVAATTIWGVIKKGNADLAQQRYLSIDEWDDYLDVAEATSDFYKGKVTILANEAMGLDAKGCTRAFSEVEIPGILGINLRVNTHAQNCPLADPWEGAETSLEFHILEPGEEPGKDPAGVTFWFGSVHTAACSGQFEEYGFCDPATEEIAVYDAYIKCAGIACIAPATGLRRISDAVEVLFKGMILPLQP